MIAVAASVVVVQACCWCRRGRASYDSLHASSHGRGGGRSDGARPGRYGLFFGDGSGGRRKDPDDSAVGYGTGLSYGKVLGAAAAMVSVRAGSKVLPARGRVKELLVRFRPEVLVCLAVLQKCLADALTWYTKAACGATYSGINVALLSDLMKFPCLALAICVSKSPANLIPTVKRALTDAPFAQAWVGAAYAAQNVLYFICLAHMTAAGYQVLSQTKLLFTAALMRVVIGKSFSMLQILALALLLSGTVATQLAEAAGPVLGSSGNVYFGGALTVLSALLAALPNVFYESCLKDPDKDQWVLNIQLTIWISLWIFGLQLWSTGLPDLGTFFVGFTPLTWVIIFLKTMNCLLVPACLKYADNILYGYAKPLAIILTCVVTAFLTSSAPSAMMVAGVLLVLASMPLYSRG